MWAARLEAAGGPAPWTAAAFRSAFHAVSAFCNAGLTLQSDNLMSVGGWQVLGVIAPLIVLGGLGFPVLYDLTRAVWGRVCAAAGRPWSGGGKITLHTKLVLSASAVLVVGGAVGLLVIENASHLDQTYGAPYHAADNLYYRPAGPAMAKLDAAGQAGAAVFQSVSARTAGFNTVDMDGLSNGGKLWMCLLMIVGGSPAGAAGGMKTVTVAVLVMSIWCMLRRRERTESFQRSIDHVFIRKAVTLAGLYLMMVLLVTLLLCVTMSQQRLESGGPASFIQLFFEACSACGTVGLSCDVTPSLTIAGKYAIMAGMFIGRLGPLTLLLALTARLRAVKYGYPSEEVILG
jgi:trk system potassium uptake protein TrkH